MCREKYYHFYGLASRIL